MASAVSIYVVIQTLALVSAYPSELFGGREAQAYWTRQDGELVIPAVPRRYALSAVENKPAQIGHGQQQERDDEKRGVVNLSDRNPPASDLMAQNSASPASNAPHAASQSDEQAPAPRDLFIKDCYEIDAEGRGRIDWYGLGSEAEAEVCFKELATKAGTPEAFAEILRSNGLRVDTGGFILRPSVTGSRIIYNYMEAGSYFGFRSYWYLQMLNPINVIATWFTGRRKTWFLEVQVIYEMAPAVKVKESDLRYKISF